MGIEYVNCDAMAVQKIYVVACGQDCSDWIWISI